MISAPIWTSWAWTLTLLAKAEHPRLLTTPLGGQFDGIVTDASGENYAYDCLWDSVGVLTPTGYVVKVRVPYSSLRRRPGDWGLRWRNLLWWDGRPFDRAVGLDAYVETTERLVKRGLFAKVAYAIQF